MEKAGIGIVGFVFMGETTQGRNVFDEYRQVLGAERICTVLVQRGHQISTEYVARLMKEMGLLSIRNTAKQDYKKLHDSEKKQNILRSDFRQIGPTRFGSAMLLASSWENTTYTLV